MDQPKHIPVLLEEVLQLLNPQPADRYLDLTAGYGGHATRVIERIGPTSSATLVDRDSKAVEHLRSIYADNKQVRILHQDFLGASRKLLEQKDKFDLILADLGISSPHIDNPERGFSISHDGPLDMRMNASQSLTAAGIVNNSERDELQTILSKYGELRNSRKLADAIIRHRPISSTSQLGELIASVSYKSRNKRIHPATQVFQALRIAVNDEIGQLERSLPLWIQLLAPGGRIGVISFHSLEDRLVKQAFTNYGGNRYDAPLQTVTKKPVMCSAEEVVFNPRARSAKLRVAQRK